MLSRRARKPFLVLVLALAATAAMWRVVRTFDLPRAAQTTPAEDSALVVRVFDGDTLLVRLGGREERVRLIGVDTPELEREGVEKQPFADEATAFIRELADGRSVTLRADPASRDRDVYDRLLRYVILPDGRTLDAEIVRAGLGFAYTRFPYERMEEYLALEREARSAGRGVWAPDAIRRVSWRDAPRYAGAVVAVRGRIVKTHDTGKICFLNFDPDYRQHLSIVIFARDYPRFDGSPDTIYRDAEVEVVGRVGDYHGRPQIVVTDPGQIRVVTGSEL
jgi:micrococcal nuclease